VLGVACHKHPPHVVHRVLGVAHSGQALAPCRVALALDGEQGSGSTGKARQWHSQNTVKAWWSALSRVLSRSSPMVMVNQAIMPRSEG
jgi:hypothetical protein